MKTITVPGVKALAEFQRLRGEYKKSGLYPIIIGEPENLEQIEIGREMSGTPEEIIGESIAIKIEGWMREKRESVAEFYPEDDGPWPTEPVDPTDLIAHLDIGSREPLEEVVIALLKISEPWQAFAHLGWGGFNDCPMPAEHCAMHRYWQEKYGSEVVSIGGATVQSWIARPPKDREAALVLAREQYVYCYDIVEQGTETIANLAAGLLNAPYWFFWWD